MWYRRLWEADAGLRPAYRVLSSLLAPAEVAYRAVVSARSWAYDRGLLESEAAPIPTLAIGNLTVGGTGKTPITAWFASQLGALGQRPAIVMRGYGGDETDVHRLLNPNVPVHIAPHRIAGVRDAQRMGANVALLDDAFQHRAIQANASVVLVAAEDGVDSPRLLPRGPWREPLTALDRANLVVTTRKAASGGAASRVAERVAELAPALPQAQAYLRLVGLAPYNGVDASLGEPRPLAGFRCRLALAGVAKPETVWAQLREAGVELEEQLDFPDHHRYGAAEIERLRRAAGVGPVVMTLKDAVKLGRALGDEAEIYVAVQGVLWERGLEEIECLLAKLVELK